MLCFWLHFRKCSAPQRIFVDSLDGGNVALPTTHHALQLGPLDHEWRSRCALGSLESRTPVHIVFNACGQASSAPKPGCFCSGNICMLKWLAARAACPWAGDSGVHWEIWSPGPWSTLCSMLVARLPQLQGMPLIRWLSCCTREVASLPTLSAS